MTAPRILQLKSTPLLFAEDVVINDDLLAILRCPLTNTKLQLADAELLAAASERSSTGNLLSRDEQPAPDDIDGGLVDEARQWFYPIVRGIPCLLIDKAIPIGQIKT